MSPKEQSIAILKQAIKDIEEMDADHVIAEVENQQSEIFGRTVITGQTIRISYRLVGVIEG